MRVAFLSHGYAVPFEKALVSLRVATHFNAKDIVVATLPGCLCRHADFSSIDAVVAHPEYDNKKGCWDRIRGIVTKESRTDFYLFADNAREREDHIGVHPNLTYINFSNIYEFASGPAAYIMRRRAYSLQRMFAGLLQSRLDDLEKRK